MVLTSIFASESYKSNDVNEPAFHLGVPLSYEK
jgi:hypothetical protein